MSSIGYVEAVQAYNSSVTSSSETQAASKKVANTQKQQAELQKQMRDLQSELKDLQAQADAINKKSGFEKFMGGLFGGDCGAGDVSDKTQKASADLKKASEELKVAQARIEMMLSEISGTQQDMAQRTSDSQKTHDESDNAAATSQS
jgi:peptidoglycan hydrolase CwlO-like protein